MKKLMALICMIACIFGLTACGSGETLTEYEQQKIDAAKQLAEELIPGLAEYSNEEFGSFLEGLTAEEIEYRFGQSGLMVDGNAFTAAMDSFSSALSSMGSITGTGESSAVIDGKQIIVEVEVTGEKKDAKAEIILSNDMFLRLESASLNPKSSMGELMGKAALNTLIGMGTVFSVLILISFLISGFKLISKIQEKGAKKKEENGAAGVENAVAQIMEQETALEETDDLELVAVIAAAVAACQGAASTDGFVVRSIRRRA